MNSSAYAAVISTDVFSVLVSIILLIGSKFSHPEKNKRTRIFEYMLGINIFVCSAHGVTWLLEGNVKLTVITWIVCFVSLLGIFVLIGMLLLFFLTYISEKRSISDRILRLSIGVTIVGTIIAGVLCFSGRVFGIYNGVYFTGDLYPVYIILNMAMLLYSLVLIIIFGDAMNKASRIVAFAYVIIPLLSAGISLYIDNNPFIYAATTITLLLISTVIQSEKMQNLEKINEIEFYHATHDQLTGLRNRRSCDERIEKLRSSEGVCGIVFSDMNGLKYANDHYGHVAGDQLLIDFVSVLTSVFRHREIYRISGDEFLCILENPPKEVFDTRLKRFRNLLAEDDQPKASVGSAFGDYHDIERLIIEAEAQMYVEKQEAHQRFANMNREET